MSSLGEVNNTFPDQLTVYCSVSNEMISGTRNITDAL